MAAFLWTHIQAFIHSECGRTLNRKKSNCLEPKRLAEFCYSFITHQTAMTESVRLMLNKYLPEKLILWA